MTETAGYISEARERLAQLRHGISMLFAIDGERRMGVRIALEAGRQVTWCLERLKSRVPGFEDWWQKQAATLAADPRAAAAYRLRNAATKEGKTPTTSTTYISHLRTDDVMANAPPGAKSFFIGDREGRSGWIVEVDGVEKTVYVDATRWGATSVILLDQGAGKPALEAAGTLVAYADLLESIVNESEKFAASGGKE